MATRDKVVQQNLDFVYGRNQGEVQIADPDKAEYVRTFRKQSDYEIPSDQMISDFSGEWEALSPFSKCPVIMKGDIQPYPSFEHALQASKFLLAEDRDQIRNIEEIREVKRFVTKHKDQLEKLVPTWNDKCLVIAKKLLRDKFMRNKVQKIRLMKTGHKALRYYNDHNELFWGINPTTKKGQNQLGKLLEEIRKEIAEGSDVDLWILDHITLLPASKVRITITVHEEKVILEDENQMFDAKPILSIGKDDSNDYVISHASISRIHCCLVAEETGQPYLLDMGSSNGTWKNGEQIESFQFVPLSRWEETVLTVGGVSKQYHLNINTTTAEQIRENEFLVKVMEENEKEKQKLTEEYVVFVRNLPRKILDNELTEFFASCGKIVKLSIPRDKMTNETKGIAFVSFEKFAGMMQALSKDEEEFLGNFLKIKRNDPKKSNGPAVGSGVGTSSASLSEPKQLSAALSIYAPSTKPSRFEPQPNNPQPITDNNNKKNNSNQEEATGNPSKQGRLQEGRDSRERGRERDGGDKREIRRDQGSRRHTTDKVEDERRSKRKEDSRDRNKDRPDGVRGEREREKRGRSGDDRRRASPLPLVRESERSSIRHRVEEDNRDDHRRREDGRRNERRDERQEKRRSESRTRDHRRDIQQDKERGRDRSRGRDESRRRNENKQRSERRSDSRNNNKRRRSPEPVRSPSHSNSPPRRKTTKQQHHTSLAPSPSPPRRPAVITNTRPPSPSPSPSPPRRPLPVIVPATATTHPNSVTANEYQNDSDSDSPPRRPPARMPNNDSDSDSPPRRAVVNSRPAAAPVVTVTRSPSNSPPRRPVCRSPSSSPSRSDKSDSPPRRPRQPSPSPSPSDSPPRRPQK